MSIKAGYLVAITPRTISAGASDLETNGMLLTKSVLLPSGTPAMAFASVAAVAAFLAMLLTKQFSRSSTSLDSRISRKLRLL